MTIRTFQAGDVAAQMRIYNEEAGRLPKVKLASPEEIKRRTSADDFDPETRFYAVEGDQVVAYATYQVNGRISYPWCLTGHERWREPLLREVLAALRKRNVRTAFAAYRGDWAPVLDFLREQGFRPAREMLNFSLPLENVPTTSIKPEESIEPLQSSDLPALLDMAAGVSHATNEDMEASWLRNPYFPPESCFVLRGNSTRKPVGVGILVTNPTYANVLDLDASMPCFRLGAFGTEGLSWKRINGLFSFMASDPAHAVRSGLTLLSHACGRLNDWTVKAIAAQAPSDVPYLVEFYRDRFELQGGFPIVELSLAG